MATYLYLIDTQPPNDADGGRAKLDGTVSGWYPRLLQSSPGAALVTKNTPTVAGPTSGVEVDSGAGIPIDFISHPLAADVTISGTITGNFWMAENNMNANVAANFIVEVLRADGTLAVIGQSSRTTELPVTTPSAQGPFIVPTSTLVKKGDRLRVRVFGDDAGTMGSGYNFSLGFNGPTSGANGDSYVAFVENMTFMDDIQSPTGSKIHLNSVASDVTGASNKEAWTTLSSVNAEASVSTQAGWVAKPGIEIGPIFYTRRISAFTLSGPIRVELRTKESNAAANCRAYVTVEVVDANGANPTLYGGGWTGNEFILGVSSYVAWVTGSDISVADGYRLRIRVYADDTVSNQMASGYLAYLEYGPVGNGDSWDSHILLSQTVTQYSTTTPVSKTLTTSYNVVGRVSKTLTASYNVKNEISKALSPSYTVKIAVSKALTANYSIIALAQVQQTLSVSYNVKAAISKALSANYNVKTETSKSLSASYAVKVTVAQALSASYTVRQVAQKALSASYNVVALTQVQKALDATYNVKVAIQKALAPSYNVRAAIPKDLSASYLLRVEASKALAASYTVKAPIQKALSASYSIVSVSQVSQTLSASYAVRMALSKPLSASYIVQVSVSQNLPASYTVRVEIPKALAASYAVNNTITKQIAASYTIKTEVSKLLAASYTVAAVISKPLAASYTIQGRITRTLTANYSILTLIQSLVPDADNAANGWQPSPASPATLFDKIDETSADDNDYIYAVAS